MFGGNDYCVECGSTKPFRKYTPDLIDSWLAPTVVMYKLSRVKESVSRDGSETNAEINTFHSVSNGGEVIRNQLPSSSIDSLHHN